MPARLPGSTALLPLLLIGVGTPGCGLLDGGAIDESCEDLPQGCGDGGGSGDDSGDPVEISITTVDPVWGGMEGGTPVVLTGGPFADDTVVRFGEVDATLLSWSKDSVQVTAPAATAAGWVDVQVQTSAGAGSKSSAYRYYADATGLTGMVGVLEHRVSTGSLAATAPVGQARIQFLAPDGSLGWWNFWADDLGSCFRDRSLEPEWSPVDPGNPTLLLEREGGGSLSLVWDGAELGYNGVSGDGSAPADIVTPGSQWTLSQFVGTDQPQLDIDPLAYVPEGITVTLPAMDDPGLALFEDELSFRWVSTRPADAVLLTLVLVDGDSGSSLERVTCAVEDTGDFTLPEGAFTLWSPGQVLYLRVSAAQEAVNPIPMDGSEARILGVYTLSSAASTL